MFKRNGLKGEKMRREYRCNCKRTVSKIIALTSIFTLTFSNFAFVGKSYASNIAEIFSNGKTHENVIFDANFEDTGTIGKEVESSINSDSLNIDLDLQNIDLDKQHIDYYM